MARTYAVTVLPVLVNATEVDAEGIATFEEFFDPHPVRSLSDADLKSCYFGLREDQKRELLAIVGLIEAYKLLSDHTRNDGGKAHWKKAVREYAQSLAARRALDLKIGLAGPDRDEKDLQWGRWLLSMQGVLGVKLGKSPKRAAALWSGRELGRKAKADPRFLLCQVISKHLRGVRVVLWWSKDAFVPALHCESNEAALYVTAMLSLGTRRGLAVCPHPRCGLLFKQSRPDQTHCTPAHREAHRVARYRERKRAAAMRRAGKRRRG